MLFKEKLKKNKIILKSYQKVTNVYYSILTLISPKLNIKARYKKIFKRSLNLSDPKTLEEKLQWLMLNNYNNNELVAKCADKYLVREYVKKCGYENILNEVYSVYDSEKEIDWGKLPAQFVLKLSFGAGMNIVCREKNFLKEKEVKRKLKQWRGSKCWLGYAEMQYKNSSKKIICERLLMDDSQKNGLVDYKVYCFHGQPRAILVMHDREVGVKTEFFSEKWEKLENTKKYALPEKGSIKPGCLEEMLEVSRKLSNPFPFVRCDFYIVNDKLYFGEMTFTPAGGLYLSKTNIDGKDMTNFLNI